MLRGYIRHDDWLRIHEQMGDVSEYIVNGRGVLADWLRCWQMWWEQLPL